MAKSAPNEHLTSAGTSAPDHVEGAANRADAAGYGGARGPDLKAAIAADPDKARRLAAGLAAWARGT